MPIYRFDQPDFTNIAASLESRNVKVYTLDGSSIRDKTLFFSVVIKQWPMGDAARQSDTPWCNPLNWTWDALADFLWQGITEVNDEAITLIWTYADVLLNANASDYSEIISVITSVDGEIRLNMSDNSGKFDHMPMFLLGDVPGFPDYLDEIGSTSSAMRPTLSTT
jgi:hypothetical protein